jgi:hypothetical protein
MPEPHQIRKPGLGIVFMHHTTDEVTLYHLDKIKKLHPTAVITPIGQTDKLPGGYSLLGTPDLDRRHAWKRERSGDVLLLSWWVQHQEQAQRWWIVEADTLCEIPITEFFWPVWEFPFLCVSRRETWRDDTWYWFSKIEKDKIPAKYHKYLAGSVPFFYVIRDDFLAAIANCLLSGDWRWGNSELRFMTAARMCGFEPCAFSPPWDRVTWIPWQQRQLTGPKSIWHPVKRIMERAT